MRILVTGGTGLIGSHAVEALVAAGHDVRLLARDRGKVERVLSRRSVVADDVIIGDMRDASAVKRALDGCEAVLHAAGAVEIGRSKGIYDANVAGVYNVIGGAVEMGLDPVIYLSSVATMFPPPGDTITVDDPVTSLKTGYGRSKAQAERYARSLQADGHPVVTFYPTAVYGPDDPAFGQTSKGLRDRIRYGWPATSGGMSSVDVRDIAAMIAAATRPGRGPRRYMTAGHFLGWTEEADLCERITGRKVVRIPLPPVALRMVGHVVDLLHRLIPGFDYPLTHEASLFVTQFRPCDSSATVEDLGVGFRAVEETYADTLRWMIECGQLAPYYAPLLEPTAKAADSPAAAEEIAAASASAAVASEPAAASAPKKAAAPRARRKPSKKAATAKKATAATPKKAAKSKAATGRKSSAAASKKLTSKRSKSTSAAAKSSSAKPVAAAKKARKRKAKASAKKVASKRRASKRG